MPYISTPAGRIFVPEKQEKVETESRIDVSKMKVLCYDLGLWTENCLRFVRDVAEVWYYVPSQKAFADPYLGKVGDNLDGLKNITGEGIEGFWDYVDKADWIFIPDTACASMVEFFKRHKYPVAGVGRSEMMELDRFYWMEKQKELGLPSQKKVPVTGITDLMKFCKENENYYIKLPNFCREIEESFKHENFKSSEDTIYRIASKLGPFKEEVVFIGEEILFGREPGLDGITFAGDLLYPTMGGYEKKGVGILERVYRTPEELPEVYRMVDEKLSPEFKKNDTRFFYSTELIEDKVLDITLRLAGPGTSAIQSELIENYTEVCAGLALGIKIKPIITKKYAAACAFSSPDANKDWLNISIPKDMRQWVKFRMACKVHGEYYTVPGFDSLGTVISLGDSINEVLEMVKDRSKEVRGKRIDFSIDLLEKITDDILEGRGHGIPF